MNPAQIQLLFAHWPFMLIVVGILILAYGEWQSDIAFKRLSFLLFIGAALFMIPVHLTSGSAQEVLFSDFPQKYTQPDIYKQLFGYSTILTYALGILAAINFFMVHNVHGLHGAVRKLMLLLAVITAVLLAYQAHVAAQIQYPAVFDIL